ncbi:MAG: hypothetical protein IKY14_04095, partial [Erysipelotrichaceae bacterium]|nr:hypothetical protein [Erysipelotrichaceae bacterium]
MNTKKIITAPTYLHETLLHELLHHYHTDALGHVAVVPQAALISALEHNSSVLLEQTFQRIQTVIDQCPHFISMIKNPSFLKQCSDFRKDMAEYQISLNNLPEQDDFQKELKLLISSFYDLPTSSASLIESLKDTAPLDHVHLYPSFQHSLFDKKVTDHFIKRGAKAIQKPQISSYKSGRSALNRRQEVEACAQYIIEHQLDPKDVTIVLCDPANDQKVLELVFDRYQLPYGFVSKTESSKIVQLYLSAVHFLKDKTLDALVHYLHLASSNLPH